MGVGFLFDLFFHVRQGLVDFGGDLAAIGHLDLEYVMVQHSFVWLDEFVYTTAAGSHQDDGQKRQETYERMPEHDKV